MQLPPISSRVKAFMESNPHLETPCLLIDLDQIENQYRLLREALPFVACYYAMKSNSAAPVIQRLNQLGSRFEAASIYEIKRCIELGVQPRDIHFGNTIKKESHIAEAYRLGIHSYSFDSEAELEKIARLAPGSNVSCRLATDGIGAVWGLCRKFGRDPDVVVELMKMAHALGLRAYGISFHVGSQQRDPEAWRRAIKACSEIIHALNDMKIYPRLINLGGGYPSYHYTTENLQPKMSIFEYGEVIREAVHEFLPEGIDCVMEPGRFICAESGYIKTEVILISERMTDGIKKRWVYLDVGRFNGMYEAIDVTYPVYTTRNESSPMSCIIAGPTCDSDDVLYDKERMLPLPADLQPGDTLVFGNVGAYSRSYTTTEFNGFPPMKEYYL